MTENIPKFEEKVKPAQKVCLESGIAVGDGRGGLQGEGVDGDQHQGDGAYQGQAHKVLQEDFPVNVFGNISPGAKTIRRTFPTQLLGFHGGNKTCINLFNPGSTRILGAVQSEARSNRPGPGRMGSQDGVLCDWPGGRGVAAAAPIRVPDGFEASKGRGRTDRQNRPLNVNTRSK